MIFLHSFAGKLLQVLVRMSLATSRFLSRARVTCLRQSKLRPAPQNTVQRCGFSDTASQDAPAPSRDDLHAMALGMNAEHHAEAEENFKAMTDLPATKIPRDVKFHFHDTVEERLWKQRQQLYYHIEDKFGYVDDILVKKGFLDQEEVDNKRDFLAKRLQSKRFLTDQIATPEISLATIKRVQEVYHVPEEMKVRDDDSPEQKSQKVKDQVQYFIKQSSESLKALPIKNTEEVKAQLAEAEKIYRLTDDDVEEFLNANEDKLKKDMPELENISEFVEKIRSISLRKAQEASVNDWTKSEPLKVLGLLKRDTLQSIEEELEASKKLAQRRLREFEIR